MRTGKRSSRGSLRDDAPRQAPAIAKPVAPAAPAPKPAPLPAARTVAAPHEDIARVELPFGLRAVLALAVAMYFVLLVTHQFRTTAWPKWMQPPMLFINSTELFPTADAYAQEYKLEGWSCTDHAWHPMDPRPYFPLHGDDKESRFQRVVHFYDEDKHKKGVGSRFLRPVMRALERYILDNHDGADDAVAGPIGGIHVYNQLTPIPAPGADVPRYQYRPLEPAPPDRRAEVYHTPESHLAQACAAGGRWVDYPVKPGDATEEGGD